MDKDQDATQMANKSCFSPVRCITWSECGDLSPHFLEKETKWQLFGLTYCILFSFTIRNILVSVKWNPLVWFSFFYSHFSKPHHAPELQQPLYYENKPLEKSATGVIQRDTCSQRVVLIQTHFLHSFPLLKVSFSVCVCGAKLSLNTVAFQVSINRRKKKNEKSRWDTWKALSAISEKW